MNETIGVAFGGGGVKGMAHLGVLNILEKKNYNIKYISGTSVGALVGGFYAYFRDAKRLEEISLEQNWKTVLRAISDPGIKRGVLKGRKFKGIIEEYIGDVKIEDLKIKFSAVATDINGEQKVVLNKGKLSDAIVASCSLPTIFKPSNIGDYSLLDGGFVEPVPVQTLEDMGCEKILAIDLHTGDTKTGRSTTILQCYQIMLKELVKEQTKDAWKTITPEFNGSLSIKKFLENGKELIEIGEKAAEKVL
jgi:NTE family protein